MRLRFLPLLAFLLAAAPAFAQHDMTVQLSNRLNELRMFDFSIYLLDQEIGKAPQDVSLLKLQKARTLFMQNKADEAEAIISAIPTSDPHYLFARFVFGTNAIEKGRNEIGVQALEAYVNSFSEANRPVGNAQKEDFQKAVYYLKHAYEQTKQTQKAVAILTKLKLLEDPEAEKPVTPEMAGRELKLQQFQAKLDSAEILKQNGETGWQALANEVLAPLRDLMWNQDLITAVAHIERARALALLGREQEGLAIFNDKNIWNFIVAFDEPFKEEGMLSAAPGAKAFLWRGNLLAGMAEKAANPQDKEKGYIDAIRAYFTVIAKYDGKQCPYFNAALGGYIKARDILEKDFNRKIQPPKNIADMLEGGGIDTTIADRHFQAGEYDKALPTYAEALRTGGRKSDKAAELTFKAAYCHLQTGAFLEAMALAGQLADRFPDDQNFTPIILLQVGEALWNLRESDPVAKEDALRVYSWYVRACPLHQYAAPISSRVANDWYERALTLAQEANKLPSGPDKAAKNQEAQEAFKAAIPMYQHIVDNYGHTEEGLRSFRLLAACYTSSKQFDKGAQVFLKYIEQEMKREDVAKRDLASVADAKFRAAQNFVQAGVEFDKQARRRREQAETAPATVPEPDPEAEPTDAAPPQTAGQLNDEAARIEADAKANFLEAVKHVDELVGPWREAGGWLAGHQSERADKAVEGAYDLLGWAYDGAGEKEKATLAFADFVKRYPDPEGKSRLVPKAMFRLAMLYLELEKINEAGQVLETLSAKYPEEGQKALPRLAKSMYAVDRFDKSIEAFRKIFAENIPVEVGDLLWAAANLWDCKGRHPKEGGELALKAVDILLPKLDNPVLADWLGRNRARELAEDPAEIARILENFRERLLFQGASAALHAEKFEASIAFLDKLLLNEKSPYFIDGRFLRGTANRRLKTKDSYNLAIADYAEISQVATFSGKHGTYFEAQGMIGDTFIEQDNFSRALGAFEIIARTDPDDDDDTLPPEERLKQRQWIEYAIYRAAFCQARLGMAEQRDEMVAKYRKHFLNGRFLREIGNLPGPAGTNAP
jgi:tetratricopeptide (TPR) repeat protein